MKIQPSCNLNLFHFLTKSFCQTGALTRRPLLVFIGLGGLVVTFSCIFTGVFTGKFAVVFAGVFGVVFTGVLGISAGVFLLICGGVFLGVCICDGDGTVSDIITGISASEELGGITRGVSFCTGFSVFSFCTGFSEVVFSHSGIPGLKCTRFLLSLCPSHSTSYDLSSSFFRTTPCFHTFALVLYGWILMLSPTSNGYRSCAVLLKYFSCHF